jgi:hypothetical protein
LLLLLLLPSLLPLLPSLLLPSLPAPFVAPGRGVACAVSRLPQCELMVAMWLA